MVFQAATTPEHFTDLPAFNDFQMSLQSFQEGHTTEEELGRVHQQLDLLLSQMLYHFYEQVQYQPPTEEFEGVAMEIYLNFDLIRDEATLALQAAAGQDTAQCEFHLAAAREGIQRLMELFADLRAQEASRPKFSELPWINELCRVAVSCRQGDLEEECLSERLEQCRELYEMTLTSLPALANPGASPATWQELRDAFSAALDQIRAGLELVSQYVSQGDEESLDEGLEQAQAGAQALLEQHRRLEELEQTEPFILCPNCSTSNALGAVRCSKCSSPFPRREDMEPEDVDSQQAWPSHVATLLSALEDLRCGRSEVDPVQDLLQQMRERFEKGLRFFQDLKSPRSADPSAAGAFEETRQNLMRESQHALEGLEVLQGALNQGNWDFLTPATERFLAGVQGLVEIHQLDQNRKA